MMPKPRNIIIFAVILVLLFGGYYLFMRSSPDSGANLISSTPVSPATSPVATNQPAQSDTGNFLTLLLNVRNIKLEDAIFNDPAFASLQDSSIVITNDGTEGRPNPFAEFGQDQVAAPAGDASALFILPDSNNTTASDTTAPGKTGSNSPSTSDTTKKSGGSLAPKP